MYCKYIFIFRMEKISKQNNESEYGKISEMCLSITSAPGHNVVQQIEFKNLKESLICYHPSLTYMLEDNVLKLGSDKTFNI
jgi:hypothetical protein